MHFSFGHQIEFNSLFVIPRSKNLFAVFKHGTVEQYIVQVHIERPSDEADIGIDLEQSYDEHNMRHVFISKYDDSIFS